MDFAAATTWRLPRFDVRLSATISARNDSQKDFFNMPRSFGPPVVRGMHFEMKTICGIYWLAFFFGLYALFTSPEAMTPLLYVDYAAYGMGLVGFYGFAWRRPIFGSQFWRAIWGPLVGVQIVELLQQYRWASSEDPAERLLSPLATVLANAEFAFDIVWIVAVFLYAYRRPIIWQKKSGISYKIT